MSDRQIKILFGVLVVLVVAWVVARLVAGGEEAPADEFNLAQLAQAELDSVIISGPEQAVRLRAGDGWTVNGHRALEESGESLKRGLEQAQLGQLVSRNPENHARLGVTEEQGRRLTVYSGAEAQLELIIGEQGGGFDQAYARRAGDNRVYLLQGNLVNLTRRRADDWRDRNILRANRDDLQRIEYEYPEASFALVRDSATWRIEPAGVNAESTALTAILNQLSNLRAIGFAADTVIDTLTWEAPSGRVRVLGPGDSELGTLVFLKREEVNYYVRREGSPVVFTVSSYTGDQILKQEEDLVAPPEEEGESG